MNQADELDELFVVRPDGRVCGLYTERLELTRIGRLCIRRLSHVQADRKGRWFAVLNGGPILGPFRRRSQAVEAEVRWLQARLPQLAGEPEASASG